MPSRPSVWWFPLVLGGVLLVLSGCEPPATAVADLPPPEVTVMKPVAWTLADEFEDTGRTAAVEDVQLRARVSGYLIEKSVPDGSEVKKGQVLFRIDPETYKATLEKSRAEVGRWQASLEKTIADLKRNEKLLPKGAISREEYDLSVAEVKISEAELKGAEADVRRAEIDLKDTEIVSPVDGRVSQSNYSLGDLVPAGGMGDASVLTTLVSIDPIWVEFNVPERTVLDLRQQAREMKLTDRPEHIKDWKWPVYVGLENEKGYPHQGIVDFVDNRIDRRTGTLRIRAVLSNADRLFQPEMFVRVKLPVSDDREVLLVPEVALGSDQGQKYVLTVDAENTVHRRLVTAGRSVTLPGSDEPYRVVLAGLKPDEAVIVNGLQRARVDAKVAPKTAPSPIVPAAKPESPKA